MPLAIRENVPLAPFITFGIGGPARYFVEPQSPEQIAEAVDWAEQRSLRLFLLGGGSNLLVRDEGFDGLVVHMTAGGIAHTGDGLVSAGAGVSWDHFVQYAIECKFAGVECLAGIPGSVGGTPVQNVGAYGQEVAQTIASVLAFDREALTFVTLDNAACNFRYRASLFNTDQPNRFIVYRVDFQLRPGGAPTITYADLQRRFANATTQPTLAEVAAAVRDIRRSKGMLIVPGDPDTRSAGSYFKNPIVPAPMLESIAAAARLSPADVPHWPAGEGQIKLPAAWLLERAGFVKGFGDGSARISTRHTLALTNRGNATFADIERLEQEIIAGVRARFHIQLEREPVLLG